LIVDPPCSQLASCKDGLLPSQLPPTSPPLGKSRQVGRKTRPPSQPTAGGRCHRLPSKPVRAPQEVTVHGVMKNFVLGRGRSLNLSQTFDGSPPQKQPYSTQLLTDMPAKYLVLQSPRSVTRIEKRLAHDARDPYRKTAPDERCIALTLEHPPHRASNFDGSRSKNSP
jgi:hypothetical protein